MGKFEPCCSYKIVPIKISMKDNDKTINNFRSRNFVHQIINVLVYDDIFLYYGMGVEVEVGGRQNGGGGVCVGGGGRVVSVI